ncbi:MAG: ABC transporter ATP-binding protein [Herpetosiphonaceae bacterium]|nr:MAG: ABC transporter ATP-binding protein [Herpetosiphonaceae bacterium]
MIELQGIQKYFNRGEPHEVHALRNINLQIAHGEFVTVIGSNGAGKSTILNIIAGVYAPDDGKVEIDGRDVTRLPEYRRAAFVGRVFQNPLDGTAGSMTVEQNLALALRRGERRGLQRGVGRQRRNQFREALASLGLGLEDRLDARVRLLSGGQRQALTLLMATLRRPDVLLLDEHTAALDPGAAAKVAELTATIVERDRLTTLMVTHNMQQALALGTRTLMMHQGQIILDISGPERRNLTVQDLIARFAAVRKDKEVIADDELLLTGATSENQHPPTT